MAAHALSEIPNQSNVLATVENFVTTGVTVTSSAFWAPLSTIADGADRSKCSHIRPSVYIHYSNPMNWNKHQSVFCFYPSRQALTGFNVRPLLLLWGTSQQPLHAEQIPSLLAQTERQHEKPVIIGVVWSGKLDIQYPSLHLDCQAIKTASAFARERGWGLG
ncbi:hypothetical protein AVEN_176357-1 [Araneus ventricosus]|uniref:Uncharacterized protein n=1 Tax=Araneus ventricosus TaxID=182803 RepID=A0A4Y2C8K7_ARAVE|nr:hypothetical protein AVEN_176357-1 [Araneus ventricosus]